MCKNYKVVKSKKNFESPSLCWITNLELNFRFLIFINTLCTRQKCLEYFRRIVLTVLSNSFWFEVSSCFLFLPLAPKLGFIGNLEPYNWMNNDGRIIEVKYIPFNLYINIYIYFKIWYVDVYVKVSYYSEINLLN